MPDRPATESDVPTSTLVTPQTKERDHRFASLNDKTWGAGNWMRCSTCPHDGNDREVYHHKNAHG